MFCYRLEDYGNLILVCMITIIMASLHAQAGTKCKCERHSADAEANGTCSRTEDTAYCTLAFTATPAEDYDAFVDRLEKMGLELNPRYVLNEAWKRPPESFSDDELVKALPVLFAISQREHFREITPEIAKIFSSKDYHKNIASLLGAYRTNSQSVTKIEVGPFIAVVSYGCMELRNNNIITMVKTRWALSEFFCSDIKR
jgi:hypothetical protein